MSDAISTKNRIIDEVTEERDRLLDAYGGLLRWIKLECVHDGCKTRKGGESCLKHRPSGPSTTHDYHDTALCEAARSAMFRAKTAARGR